MSQSAFPSALAHTICANIGTCCQQAHQPHNEASCETVLGQAYGAAFARDAGAFDPNVAGECLDGLGAAARRCDFTSSMDTEACRTLTSKGPSSAVHGSAGDPCNTTCGTQGGASTCVSFVSAGDGGVISSSGALATCYTDDGLYCDTTAQRCAALAKVGAPCSSGSSCQGSYCATETSVCTEKLSEGSACSTDVFEDECKDGLVCSRSPGGAHTCARPKAIGAACDTSRECTSGECRNGTCDLSSVLRLGCAP